MGQEVTWPRLGMRKGWRAEGFHVSPNDVIYKVVSPKDSVSHVFLKTRFSRIGASVPVM